MKKVIKCSTFQYADEIIQEAFDDVSCEYGIGQEDIPRCTFAEITPFKSALERNLTISLRGPVRQVELPELGIAVSGNASGVANDIVRKLFNLGWTQLTSAEDIELAISEARNFYTTDRYGYVVPSTRSEVFRILNLGETGRWRGLGSGASFVLEDNKVYQDEYGNIRVNRTSRIYD